MLVALGILVGAVLSDSSSCSSKTSGCCLTWRRRLYVTA